MRLAAIVSPPSTDLETGIRIADIRSDKVGARTVGPHFFDYLAACRLVRLEPILQRHVDSRLPAITSRAKQLNKLRRQAYGDLFFGWSLLRSASSGWT
jgi:hypothetical protein